MHSKFSWPTIFRFSTIPFLLESFPGFHSRASKHVQQLFTGTVTFQETACRFQWSLLRIPGSKPSNLPSASAYNFSFCVSTLLHILLSLSPSLLHVRFLCNIRSLFNHHRKPLLADPSSSCGRFIQCNYLYLVGRSIFGCPNSCCKHCWSFTCHFICHCTIQFHCESFFTFL